MSRLGQGGMGTVYLAEAPDGRPVAIKAINPEYADQEEFRGRFRSEVNRARQVPPFCTAELLDADADHATPYLVVEYVDGPSLAELVAARGPLTGGNLQGVAVGVATALAAIHGAGVIHRDLKPANVLFALGTPKVIDFGIARAFEATSQHTRTDQLVGTVAYMAPERFDDDPGRVGPAADVFAWGVVVAYAATGRTPFGGDSAAATAGRILTRPPRLDGLPAPLHDLVARALDKEPEHRPTAFEVLDELVGAGAATTVDLAEVRAAALTPASRPAAGAATPDRAAGAVAPEPAAHAPAPQSLARPWRRLAPLLAGVLVLAVAAGVLALRPWQGRHSGSSLSAAAPVVPVSLSPRPSPVPVTPASASSPRASSPASAPRPSRRASSAAAAGPVVAPPLSTPKPAAKCRDADLAVTITAQSDTPATGGTQRGLVTVANDGDTACRVDGRVFVTLHNAADERVEVPSTAVDEPGAAVDILLRPGTGAFQGIKWQACDRGAADCPTGNTLHAGLSAANRGVVAELENFPDPSRSLITMASLEVGTLQPSTQGVVAW
ncbi:protein kinase [Actinoplanes sp. N902-109]|uniref:protein kinase domain-containing protein n=1 Tax=Actinoplanes sp. (strain N902-109) TaxID=649831 RepID=UPI0003295A86|nr:protein kinase [Actinoplanes sp. N902-109]AGL19102.1 serine/threonine protein kinase-like protein [Actinoplanes sp. N902-109]